MIRRLRVPLAVCAALTLAAGLATAAAAADRQLFSSLSGRSEVPKKGDPDGSATATLTFKPAKGQVCYDLRPRKIEKAAAAHIHTGSKGRSGAIVLSLFTSPRSARNGRITGCVKASRSLRSSLLAKPANFYANIHTRRYGSGAVRGQLRAMP